jgi:hypothetical protein
MVGTATMSILHPPPPPAPESWTPRPAVPPPLDERDLLARLRTLHETGRIGVAVNRAKLSHMDFPLGIEADGNRWAYAIVIIVVAIWWFLGIYAGVGSAVAGFLFYQTVGQRWIARRLEQRIHDKGLGDVDNWRKLWRFGGVILTDTARGETCLGPEGRWMAFVQAVEQAAGKNSAP